MTDWAHLPSAKHIDQMLDDIPKWAEAPKAARARAKSVIHSPALTNAHSTARTIIQATGRFVARDGAWGVAWRSIQAKRWDAHHDAAWSAISALTAYDSCAPLLNYSAQELRALIALTESPAAILLLPRAILKDSI